MAFASGEYERLLTYYRARVDAFAGVDARYGERWRRWCRTLRSVGGSLVVPPREPEPDLEALLAEGVALTSPVQLSPGEPGDCHSNVAARWIDGTIARIGTGCALSGDDLWRQHSWGLNSSDELVETSDQRHAYVGITVAAGPASMQFAGSNAPDHLKTVLRRGPRAAELARMIHELAGLSSRQ
ncbi:hypothetical protein [Actinoplanes sp. NPDC049265]|uniref:hypothetical protein n=1 Tax=Actinoplanes sp. NPDC049265 TaxID=3363902 RepID=UPI00371EDFC8